MPIFRQTPRRGQISLFFTGTEEGIAGGPIRGSSSGPGGKGGVKLEDVVQPVVPVVGEKQILKHVNHVLKYG